MIAERPPTMFPLPGRTHEYSTPISTESRNAVSSICTESRASARNNIVSMRSLASPSVPGSPERSIPMWLCASMNAGVTTGNLPMKSPLRSVDTPLIVFPSKRTWVCFMTSLPV